MIRLLAKKEINYLRTNERGRGARPHFCLTNAFQVFNWGYEYCAECHDMLKSQDREHGNARSQDSVRTAYIRQPHYSEAH